jgi:response regulator of citrate/malate metabolism
MKDQHTKIVGYRSLSQDEIDLMNKIKLHGQVMQELIAEVKLHLLEQRHEADDDEERRLAAAEPARWAAIAKTHMQESLMCLTRAVAQPTSF